MLRHLIVGRKSISRKKLRDERRLTPVARKEEIVERTQDTSFGNSLLHESSCAFLAIEVVEDKIAVIDRRVKTLVQAIDSLWGMLEAELIDSSTELVVTIVATCIVHVISCMIGHDLGWSIDTRTECCTAKSLDQKIFVSSSKGLLAVFICLVETIDSNNTLLLDIKLIFAC